VGTVSWIIEDDRYESGEILQLSSLRSERDTEWGRERKSSLIRIVQRVQGRGRRIITFRPVQSGFIRDKQRGRQKDKAKGCWSSIVLNTRRKVGRGEGEGGGKGDSGSPAQGKKAS